MRTKVISVIFIIVFSMVNVSADSYAGKVKNLYVNASGLVLVNLDNGGASMNCGHATWPLKFMLSDVAADHWMSLLLTARAQNKTIKVGYTASDDVALGSCAPHYFFFHGFDE